MHVDLHITHARRMRRGSLIAARTRKATGQSPRPAMYAARYWHREVLRAKGMKLRGFVWID